MSDTPARMVTPDEVKAAREKIEDALREFVDLTNHGLLSNWVVMMRTTMPQGADDYGFVASGSATASDMIGLAELAKREFMNLVY